MRTLEPVKEFWTYTLLRIALFLGSAGIVYGIWAMVADTVPSLPLVAVIGFVVSGVGSYFLLNHQREAFARRVDERARRASARIDELRSKEDADGS
jgi:hypothetical protein